MVKIKLDRYVHATLVAIMHDWAEKPPTEGEERIMKALKDCRATLMLELLITEWEGVVDIVGAELEHQAYALEEAPDEYKGTKWFVKAEVAFQALLDEPTVWRHLPRWMRAKTS